jgi:hypothetical protein
MLRFYVLRCKTCTEQLHFTVKLLHCTLCHSAYEMKLSLLITLENVTDFQFFSLDSYL